VSRQWERKILVVTVRCGSWDEREVLTSNLFCPTGGVTIPIPVGFGQQGQDCPEQLLLSHSEYRSVLAAGERTLFCASQAAERRQGQVKEAKCCKKKKKSQSTVGSVNRFIRLDLFLGLVKR